MDVMTATTVMAAQVCPKAPPGAQAPVNEITAYVLWGVGTVFLLGIVLGVGALAGSRALSMPHAGKAGIVSIVMIFGAAIAYLVLPGMLDGLLGRGCI